MLSVTGLALYRLLFAIIPVALFGAFSLTLLGEHPIPGVAGDHPTFSISLSTAIYQLRLVLARAMYVGEASEPLAMQFGRVPPKGSMTFRLEGMKGNIRWGILSSPEWRSRGLKLNNGQRFATFTDSATCVSWITSRRPEKGPTGFQARQFYLSPERRRPVPRHFVLTRGDFTLISAEGQCDEEKDGHTIRTQRVVAFRCATVFDVAQTEGKELPELNCNATTTGDALLPALESAAGSFGIQLTYNSLPGSIRFD
jgi:hypothetical protein